MNSQSQLKNIESLLKNMPAFNGVNAEEELKKGLEELGLIEKFSENGYVYGPYMPIEYIPRIIESKSAKTEIKNTAYKKSEGEYIKIEKP